MVPRGIKIGVALALSVTTLLPCAFLLGAGSGWRRVWLDSRQWTLLWNSIAIAGGAAALGVGASFVLAVLVARTDLSGRGVLAFAPLLQFLIAPHMLAIAGQQMFGPAFQGISAAIVVLAVSYYPLAFFAVLAGLRTPDPALEEAALLVMDGRAVLLRLTSRLVRRHVYAGFLLIFLLSLVEFGVPDILRVNTYPVEIFAQFSAFYDEAAAAALCAPLLLLTLAVVVAEYRLVGGLSLASLRFGPRARLLQVSLGSHRRAVSGAAWLVAGGVLAAPVAWFAHRAGAMDTVWKAAVSAPLVSSIAVAAAGATLVLVFAFPLAYAADRDRGVFGAGLRVAALLPLALPATVIGIGLIRLWNRGAGAPIYGTWLMLPLAYLARFTPFAAVVLIAGLGHISREQEEAGLVCGRGWRSRVFRIVVPQLRGGLAAAWALVFVLCLGELGTTLLLVPPGGETLTLRMFNLLHYGAHESVSALCLLLVAAALPACALAAVWARRVAREGA